MSAQESMDMDQRMDGIMIETPLQKEILTGVPFEEAMQKVVDDVKQLHQSNNYTEIKIHYGVGSKMAFSHQERVASRKEEILNLKIAEEMEAIKKVISASSEADLSQIQGEYHQNLQLIEARSDAFDKDEFYPYIYIQAKKKKPLYGKIFNQFDYKGVARLHAAIGYRSPFSVFDRIEFNMETPPFKNIRKREYYQFGLNWTLPIDKQQQTQFYVNTQTGNAAVFQGVDEKKTSFQVGLSDSKDRLELEIGKRYPKIFENVSEGIQRGYHVPSTKVSLKYDQTYEDTLERGEIYTGKYTEGRSEATIPFLSQAQFFKYQLTHRRFFDIYGWGRNFQSIKLKSFLQHSNIELCSSLKAIYMHRNTVSDLMENLEVRGFENNRKPSTDWLQLKSSIKLNNYNYPLLGGLGFAYFFYLQGGVAWNESLKLPYALASTGLGMSFALNKMVNIELLCCLAQAQSEAKREPVNFQIRIGMND